MTKLVITIVCMFSDFFRLQDLLCLMTIYKALLLKQKSVFKEILNPNTVIRVQILEGPL